MHNILKQNYPHQVFFNRAFVRLLLTWIKGISFVNIIAVS